MTDVALFPIPGSVNFPGVPCPLHVFEPRYRQMVKHCVDSGMLMGVCHTEKVVHESPREQDLKQALASNQSTYKPCQVFSAGAVSLLEELDDGRVVIEVAMNERLRLCEQQQTLPFNIWRCESLPDQQATPASELALQQAQEKIMRRLSILTHGVEELEGVIDSDFWQTMSARTFSFSVMGLLGFEPEMSQFLLEMTDPVQRLNAVLTALNQSA